MIFASQSGTPRPREVKPLPSVTQPRKGKVRLWTRAPLGPQSGWDWREGHGLCDSRIHPEPCPGVPPAKRARGPRPPLLQNVLEGAGPAPPVVGRRHRGSTATSRCVWVLLPVTSGLGRGGFSPAVGGTGAPPPSASVHVHGGRRREDGGSADHQHTPVTCPGDALRLTGRSLG